MLKFVSSLLSFQFIFYSFKLCVDVCFSHYYIPVEVCLIELVIKRSDKQASIFGFKDFMNSYVRRRWSKKEQQKPPKECLLANGRIIHFNESGQNEFSKKKNKKWEYYKWLFGCDNVWPRWKILTSLVFSCSKTKKVIKQTSECI